MSDDELAGSGIDLEAYDLGHMVKFARTATFAPNWKMVLGADAFVGVVLIALGVLAAQWIWLGWILVAVGAVYLFMVMRRFLQWRWLRQQVGL